MGVAAALADALGWPLLCMLWGWLDTKLWLALHCGSFDFHL